MLWRVKKREIYEMQLAQKFACLVLVYIDEKKKKLSEAYNTASLAGDANLTPCIGIHANVWANNTQGVITPPKKSP